MIMCRAEADGLTLLKANNNKTGYFGVCHRPGKPKPYHAQVKRGDRMVHLGCFDSAEEAELNNELEITQRGGEEFAARALDVQFTDVDVITDITI